MTTFLGSIGVPHYTKDGKLYTGEMHKDANGRLMSGKFHTANSQFLFHNRNGVGGIKGVGDKEYDRIIHEINSKNGVSYENQGWFALANKKSNAYYIEFQKGYWTFTQKDDVMRFYKNKESFAKRVSELIRKGF
jgi:hypothetical protein